MGSTKLLLYIVRVVKGACQARLVVFAPIEAWACFFQLIHDQSTFEIVPGYFNT